MSSQIVLRERSIIRRQPLLQSRSQSSFYSFSSASSSSSSSSSSACASISSSSCGFAEVAGGTTAECAAVCCCCPCGIVNLLVLAIYKVPAGLCRAALKKKRRKRLMKKGLLPPLRRRCQCGCDETELQIHGIDDHSDFGFEAYSAVIAPIIESEREVFLQLEKEMLERFYGTGFWRSLSQRETIVVNTPTTTTTTK